MKPKILFILHEDTRTGAPNALLSFLNYTKEKHPNNFIIDIFVLRSTNGELEPELKNIARNFYIKRKKKSISVKLLNTFKPTTPLLYALQTLHKYDIIYGNTILTLKYLSQLKTKFPKVKTLLHVHESEYLTSLFLNKNTAIKQFQQIDKILTVSKSALENLNINYNVDLRKITVIYPSILKTETTDIQNPLKDQYKDSDLILVNIGQPILTKGTDLIPQIASLLHKRNPNLKFKILIVGILNDSDYVKAIKLDIKKLHLENFIELVPYAKKPMNYLEISSACLISAREESFSLIAAHAAIFEKPIIAFKNAIGILDIFDENCSFQADYLNIEDFVVQIEQIYENPDLVKQKTALAREKYDTFLDSDIINQKHFNELNKMMQ